MQNSELHPIMYVFFWCFFFKGEVTVTPTGGEPVQIKAGDMAVFPQAPVYSLFLFFIFIFQLQNKNNMKPVKKKMWENVSVRVPI